MERTPLETMDTPNGRLYRPPGSVVQILSLIAVFFGGPFLGELIGRYLGGLSEAAQIVLYLPFVAIFFLGYALWMARLSAIAFEGVGKGILKALFLFVIRRRKPGSVHEFLPSREKLLEMAVKAQKAAWSFLVVAAPVSLVAMLAMLPIDSPASTAERVLLVGGGSVGWGYLLGMLGRRGILPFMEED